MKKISFLLVGGLSVFLFLLAGSAYALKITPTVVELKAKPGEILSRTIEVMNETENPLSITANFSEAEGSESEGGVAKYSKPTETSTLANWITFEGESSFDLASGEKRKVSFIVTVPENAPPGGHYAAINWFPQAADVQSGAAVTGGIATNIALDVAGTVTEKGDIVSFTTQGDIKKYDKLPVNFVTRINNSGSRHFKPKGSIIVKDMFGKEVVSLPVNVTNAGGNVLPGSTREFKATWDSGFAFGKYTAVLDVMLGGAGKKTATYEFWVMPAGLAILWVIILIVVLLILGLLIKNMMLAMKKK